MCLQRRSVFVLLLFLQIVSSLNLGEEAPNNKSDLNSTLKHHVRRWKKTSTRTLKLTENATTNIEELGDKGRFLKKFDVVTCDGYILNLFRMTFQNNEPKHKDFPVLLVPGLYQSSDRFVKQNTEHSLAFMLQDLGYDVWLANVRGNKYGRRHMYLEPDSDEKAKFFDYSYHEIAFYDIPVIVDYILNDTRKEKVHYIGHSLGGTVFLVLNSVKPEYNDKFETAHLLAPIGYQTYFPNKNFMEEANRFKEIYGDLMTKGQVEIFPFEEDGITTFSVDDCLGNNTYKNICEELKIDELMGLKKLNNSKDETRGGSVKLLAHLAQNIKYKIFNRWDYGDEKNMKLYNIKESPIYNLSHITAPTKIIYASNDEYVSAKDIADMASNMGNASIREVKRKDFKHQDFIVASDVMETVYNDIIEDLRNINSLKELRKESDDSDDSEYVEDPVTSTKRPGKKNDDPKSNMKLFLPLYVWIIIIIWLPRLLLPIAMGMVLVIFFCCLKKFETHFKMGMKADKLAEKLREKEIQKIEEAEDV